MHDRRFYLVLLLLCSAKAFESFYSLTATDIHGQIVSLQQYEGKVCLVVNVASECGYTDVNYRELVKIQRVFEGEGFTVLAFPCNDFGGQEPASNRDVLHFATERYHINFPIFSKVSIMQSSQAGVYRHLIEATGSEPSWNFCKYLVDRQGRTVQFFSQNSDFGEIRRSIKYVLGKHNEL